MLYALLYGWLVCYNLLCLLDRYEHVIVPISLVYAPRAAYDALVICALIR